MCAELSKRGLVHRLRAQNAGSGHRCGLGDKCALSVSKRSYTRPMWQPGALSRTVLAIIWLVLGIAMIAVSVWLGWTRWLAILNGHPAMLIAGIACGLLGFIAVLWAIGSLTVGGRQDREGDPEHPAHRTSTQVLRRAHWRIIFTVPALVLAFLLVVVLASARPFVATPAPPRPSGRRMVCGSLIGSAGTS
jgi:MFS superfamily sulfate permease-like transporter